MDTDPNVHWSVNRPNNNKSNNLTKNISNMTSHESSIINSAPSSPQSSCNSSYGSNSGQKLLNSANSSITSQVPGGVVTTQNISTVIRPKGNDNSLQFVKIQTPDLSRKAVEQIRMAEETKISKNKIKEVEEEWQNNLLEWKSKRRQQFSHTYEPEPNELTGFNDPSASGRKIKTFAEILEERAKSGNRLGFHLQRYIGEDENDEQEHSFLPRDEQTTCIDNEEQLVGNSKSRVDSDYEAHSSTSSGYNQPDSKSPSSPETPLDNLHISDKIPRFPVNNAGFEDQIDNRRLDEAVDKHSISLIDGPTSGQINSTLRHDIIRSPATEFKNCSLMNSESKNPKVVTSRCDDESDNSIYEEGEDEDDEDDDGEEEEEQKHLQRIEFEAKLKAFERLTKPINKPPPPTVFKRDSDVSKPRSEFSQREEPVTIVSPNFRSRAPIILPKVDTTDFVSPNREPSCTIDSMHHDITNSSTTSFSNQPSPPTHKQTSPITMINNNHRLVSADELVNKSIMKNTVTMASTASNNNNTIINDTNNVNDSNNKIPPALSCYNRNRESIVSPPKPLVAPHRSIDQIAMPKQESMSQQQKSNYDNKDRTILSVSGKRRCSSCREELGRGAAAFVVESLSLVYHTNCFRCSVCHESLSNGFQGVDVRVHAGALHCQNCYSKDGLNYSRV